MSLVLSHPPGGLRTRESLWTPALVVVKQVSGLRIPGVVPPVTL